MAAIHSLDKTNQIQAHAICPQGQRIQIQEELQINQD